MDSNDIQLMKILTKSGSESHEAQLSRSKGKDFANQFLAILFNESMASQHAKSVDSKRKAIGTKQNDKGKKISNLQTEGDLPKGAPEPGTNLTLRDLKTKGHFISDPKGSRSIDPDLKDLAKSQEIETRFNQALKAGQTTVIPSHENAERSQPLPTAEGKSLSNPGGNLEKTGLSGKILPEVKEEKVLNPLPQTNFEKTSVKTNIQLDKETLSNQPVLENSPGRSIDPPVEKHPVEKAVPGRSVSETVTEKSKVFQNQATTGADQEQSFKLTFNQPSKAGSQSDQVSSDIYSRREHSLRSSAQLDGSITNGRSGRRIESVPNNAESSPGSVESKRHSAKNISDGKIPSVFEEKTGHTNSKAIAEEGKDQAVIPRTKEVSYTNDDGKKASGRHPETDQELLNTEDSLRRSPQEVRGKIHPTAKAQNSFSAVPPGGFENQSVEGKANRVSESFVPRNLSSERVFDQIVERIQLDKLEGRFRLNLTLKPEFLGRIHIETQFDSNQSLKAVLRVEDPAVRNLVESNLSQIVDKLNQSGINVGRAEVADFGTDANQNRNGQDNPQGNPEGNAKQSQDERETTEKRPAESGSPGVNETESNADDDDTVSLFA